jgi:hypothetical protein
VNCQETRKLFEDALDRRLSGGVKRRLDLHLARCRDCRKFYEAEQAEHARWFRALNAAEPPHSLPPDFADRLVAAVAANDAMDKASFFRCLCLPKWLKRVACLAVLLFGVAFAATVVVDAMTAKEGEREETEATEAFDENLPGAETATSPSEAPAVASKETNTQQPTTTYQTNGESEMKKGKAAAAALALVALGAVSEVQSTTPLRTASSLYKSGCEPAEPAPASSVSSASGASAPLDSRAAQSATSEAVMFDSDGVPGVTIIFR